MKKLLFLVMSFGMTATLHSCPNLDPNTTEGKANLKRAVDGEIFHMDFYETIKNGIPVRVQKSLNFKVSPDVGSIPYGGKFANKAELDKAISKAGGFIYD